MRGDSDEDFGETIDAAWRRFVLPSLLAKGIRSELFVSRTELEPVHIAACEHFLTLTSPDQALREELRRAYSVALDLALSSTTLWIDDADQNLQMPDPNAPRAWSHQVVTR